MTKGELIEAMADFPYDMPVKVRHKDDDVDAESVEEICPTLTDTSENYLLIV